MIQLKTFQHGGLWVTLCFQEACALYGPQILGQEKDRVWKTLSLGVCSALWDCENVKKQLSNSDVNKHGCHMDFLALLRPEFGTSSAQNCMKFFVDTLQMLFYICCKFHEKIPTRSLSTKA